MNEYQVTKLRKQLQRKQEQLKQQKEDHQNTQRQLVQVQAERDRFYSELVIARKTIENVDQIIAENIKQMKLRIQKQNSQSLQDLQRLREKLVEEKLLREKLEQDTKNKESVISELSLRLREMSRKYKDPSLLVNTRQVADQVAITNNNYYKLTQKYNKLCSDMENILAENKILRKLHGVPDNFGFDLEEIKIAQKQELQDYKAQCRKLQTEIEELQAQRTQLRYRLRQYNTLFSTKGERYKDMTQQQMDLLDQYAMNLKEGKFELPQIDKTQKQMERQIIKLKGQIEILQNKGGSISRPVQSEQVSVQHLKKMEEQMNKLINPLRDQMRKLAEMNGKIAPDNSNNQIINNNSNVNVVFESRFKAPMPLPVAHNDWSHVKDGYSYMFNSKIPINLKEFSSETEFNIAKAKYQIAALQLQNIQSLKILKEKQTKQSVLYKQVEDLKGKYDKCLRVQDQLFIRYFKQKQQVNDRIHKLQIEKNNILNDQRQVETKLGIIQDSYNALIKKTDVEKKNQQLTNKLAISESQLHKLKRIYNVLNDQHKMLRQTYTNLQGKTSSAEFSLKQKLAHVKENQKKLTFYLNKILQQQANAVPGELHNSVVNRLQSLTDKSMNSAIKQTELRVKINKLQNIERQINRKEDIIETLREDSFDINLQLQIVKKRLENTDPDYRAFQNIFRKFIGFVNQNNISLITYFKKFDKDGSGQLGKNQLLSAIKALNFQITNNEFELMFNEFDLDGSQSVTYREFIRKMRRSGVLNRNKQQEGLFRLFKAIKDAKISIRKAFQIIDSDGSNEVNKGEMTSAFRRIGIDASSATIDYIFRVCDTDNSGSINCNQFEKLFEDIIKESAIEENDIFSNEIDWKLLFVIKMDEVSTKYHKGGLKETFKSLDSDGISVLTINQLTEFFQKAGIEVAKNSVIELFEFLDRQRDGKVEYIEFLKILEEAKAEKRRVDRNKYIKTRIQELRKQNQGSKELSNSKVSEEKSSQVRIMALQAKLGALLKKNEKMIRNLANKQQENIELKKEIEQHEKSVDKVRDQYYKEKGRTADLQAKLAKMIPELQSRKILEETNRIKIENIQTKGQLQTYKSMYVSLDAKLRNDEMRQAKIQSQNEKYYEIVKQLQGGSDIAAQLGKRAQELEYSKRNEELVNKKYESVIEEMRSVQNQNNKIVDESLQKQDEIIKTHYMMQKKSQMMQKTIDDLSSKILPTVSVHRIEELLLKMREISNSKSQIQKELRELSEVNYNLQLRNDYIENQKVHIEQLEKKLKRTYTDESSVTIIELTKKLADYKMNQLKAKRQCGLLKEKQEYHIRLNNNNNESIKEIQEELASWERKYNQRQEFWRNRMSQQLKLTEDIQKEALKTKEQERNAEIFFKQQEKNDQKIDNQFKALSSDKQNMLSSVIRRSNNSGSQNIVFELKSKIQQLEQELSSKQKEIYQLKSTFKQIVPQAKFTDFGGQMNTSTTNFVMQTELTTSQLRNNARRFINNQKQSETYYKDQATKISMAAQQSIETLQRMIDDKNDQLKRKEKIIEDLKREYFKIKEQDTREIQKLHEEIRELRTKSQTANLNDIMSRPTGKNFYNTRGGNEVDELRRLVLVKEDQIKSLQEKYDRLFINKQKKGGQHSIAAQKTLERKLDELQDERDAQKRRYMDNEEHLTQKIKNLQKLSKEKDVKLAKLQKTLIDLKNMAVNQGKKAQNGEIQKQLMDAIATMNKGTSANDSRMEIAVQKSLQTVQELSKKNKQYQSQNKRLREEKFNRTQSKRK